MSQPEPKNFTFSNQNYILLILIHLAFVLPIAYFLNIWMDEASALYTTQNGVLDALDKALHYELQAPIYFLLLSVWRKINDSIFFARLFSVFCNIITIRVFYELLKRYLPANPYNFWILLFLVINPYFVWAGAELRGYALLILISALLLKEFFDGYIVDEPSKKSQSIYFLLAIIALYTNYYLGFLLFANFCGLLVLRRWKSAIAYFWQMAIVGIIFLPLLYSIFTQTGTVNSRYIPKKSWIEGIKIMWSHWQDFFLPANETILSFPRLWLVRVGLLGLIIYSIIKRGKNFATTTPALFIIPLIISAFFVLTYFYMGVEYVAFRHMAVMFFPILLLLGSIFVKTLNRTGWIAVGFLSIIFYGVYFQKTYSPLAKRGDWNRVANFIQSNESENQPIIAFWSYDSLSLILTYKGKNQIIPQEQRIWVLSGERDEEHSRMDEINYIISLIPPNHEKIWVATHELCQNPETKKVCSPLEKYLEENYTIEVEKDFYLEKVRLMKRK